MGNETKRYPCPCCGYLTLPEKPTGTYYICDVCRWEDDNVQFHDPEYRGGANAMSLREAKENFQKFGAKDQKFLDRVRPPRPEEMPSAEL